MADVTVTYNGQNILEMSATGRKTLKTAKKRCKTDIDVAYVRPGAGSYQSKTVTPSASQQTVLPDSGYSALSQVVVSGDADLVPGNIKSGVDIFGVVGTYDGSIPEPALPAEYQRVEYLQFEPSVGIIVTIPTIGYVCYAADMISTKMNSSEDLSIVFGFRQSSSTGRDFELGATYNAVYSWLRYSGTGYGLEMYHNASYTPGNRKTVYITLKTPRSTALIGRYAYYDSGSVNSEAFKGKFYSLKGTNIETNQTVAWFVPCYRKSDNKVGVYDHIAQAFYYETYATGSGYSITAGPDVN